MPFHIGFLSRSQMDALKAAGEGFALTEVQKAVAVLKQTPIGTAVAADIKAVQNQSLSNADKMQAVVDNSLPRIVQYVSKGGFQAVEADVLSIGKELAQSVFNDLKSTTAGKVAQAVLALLGK